MVNGEQLFAKLKIKMEPDEKVEAGVGIRTAGVATKLSGEMMDGAREELTARGEGGGLIGSFPLAKIRISLVDAEVTEESNDIAFRMAAGDAFEKALRDGTPTLLEPIMKVTINTPDEYYGDFIGDLSQRRAQIVNTDSKNGRTTIEAHAPLGELFGYSNAMRSLSQGRAGSSIEPLHYAAAPAEIADGFKF